MLIFSEVWHFIRWIYYYLFSLLNICIDSDIFLLMKKNNCTKHTVHECVSELVQGWVTSVRSRQYQGNCISAEAHEQSWSLNPHLGFADLHAMVFYNPAFLRTLLALCGSFLFFTYFRINVSIWRKHSYWDLIENWLTSLINLKEFAYVFLSQNSISLYVDFPSCIWELS